MNTDSKAELLPCPFCGDHAETDFIPEHHSYAIECHSIGCAARVIKETAEDAVAAWNRRATAAQVPQEPTSKQVVLGAGALLGQPENTADNRHPDWHSAVEKARSVYLAMLAAAPETTDAAPVRDPLTDAEIESATGAMLGTPLFLAAKGFTIAVERAHGIGSKHT